MVLGALARRPFGAFDLGVSTGALIGYALPSFWAQLAMLTIAFRTGWFPIRGLRGNRAKVARNSATNTR